MSISTTSDASNSARFRFSNLSFKMPAFLLAFSLVLIAVMVMAAKMTIARVLENQYRETLQTTSVMVLEQLEKAKTNALAATSWFEQSARLTKALKEGDRDSAIGLGKTAISAFGLDYFVITDPLGVVFVRAHEPTVHGDSILKQVNITRALQGEQSVGVEEGAVVKLSIRAGTPLRDGTNIIGVVSLGYVFSNNEFVDRLKRTFDCEFSVFSGGDCVATTLKKNGQRMGGPAIGQTALIESVQKRGEPYLGKVNLAGQAFWVICQPVRNVKGEVAGVLLIGKSLDIVSVLTQQVLVWVGGISVLLCVLVLLSVIPVVRALILSPLDRAVKLAQAIAQGDLTVRLNLKSNDEIGQLTTALDAMSTNLDSVLMEINQNTSQVTQGSQQISDASQSLSQGATESASSLQEITSSMTQVAAQTKTNAENAGQANGLSKTARDAAETGSNQMKDMVLAMNDINASSQQIAKIIKVIHWHPIGAEN